MTSSAINPLFSYFYLSDIHLLLTTEKFEVISKLRQNFDAKSQPLLKPIKSVNSSTGGSDPRWRAIKDWPKIMKFSQMSYRSISTFEVLIKCMETVVQDYGPRYAIDSFWVLVSNGMKSKGFYEFSASECQRLFCLYVNDVYGLVFIFYLFVDLSKFLLFSGLNPYF